MCLLRGFQFVFQVNKTLWFWSESNRLQILQTSLPLLSLFQEQEHLFVRSWIYLQVVLFLLSIRARCSAPWLPMRLPEHTARSFSQSTRSAYAHSTLCASRCAAAHCQLLSLYIPHATPKLLKLLPNLRYVRDGGNCSTDWLKCSPMRDVWSTMAADTMADLNHLRSRISSYWSALLLLLSETGLLCQSICCIHRHRWHAWEHHFRKPMNNAGGPRQRGGSATRAAEHFCW